MSKIVDINTLTNQENFNAIAANVISDLQKENDLLKSTIKHLESLLIAQVVTPEEMICVKQIEVLRNRSDQKELTTDEVKRLDLLIKNLRLIRGESTSKSDIRDVSNTSEAELIAIARGD